jgi:hydroxymethylbilane synthase
LALAQAEMTEAALRAAHPALEIERRVITTTGDRRTDVPLSDVAKAEGHLDKGVFIKELEAALEEGEIDVAVHSLKDMPSELESRFEIAAVLPRAPVGDVLLTKGKGGLAGLKQGATIATSAVRRQRLLRWMRPDLKVTDIRGNVPTRIRKLHESGEIDGILLAEAGLMRLGLLVDGEVRSDGQVAHAAVLDVETFLPAAGQGAVALEIRAGDEAVRALAGAINHDATFDAVTAERKFLELLGAGCETPVGVQSRLEGEELLLRAVVFEDGEAEPLQAEARGHRSDPGALARRLVGNLSRMQS